MGVGLRVVLVVQHPGLVTEYGEIRRRFFVLKHAALEFVCSDVWSADSNIHIFKRSCRPILVMDVDTQVLPSDGLCGAASAHTTHFENARRS